MSYTAYIGQENGWFIGWVQGVRGVNCQERTQRELIKSLKIMLAEMLDYKQPGIEQASIDGFEPITVAGKSLPRRRKRHHYSIWTNPDSTKFSAIPNHGDDEEVTKSVIEWICRDLEVPAPDDDD